MSTLKLTLKKQWFDMINSGEKREEYREIKSYWIDRLFNFSREYNNWHNRPKCFDYVEFRNGYSKNAPTIICEFKGIEIKTGYKNWGAVENQKYITIKLGEIVERKNLEIKTN